MRIQNNITAQNANRMLAGNNLAASKTMQKLSSGYRVNSAADDAAGLAISEKMRSQIRGLAMAAKNSQDGISLIQTAEGALHGMCGIMQRMRELAVQAASDTNTPEDRACIDLEIQQLKQELDVAARQTRFNDMPLLDGSLSQGSPGAVSPSAPFAVITDDTVIWEDMKWLASVPATTTPVDAPWGTGNVDWTNISGKNLDWLKTHLAEEVIPNIIDSMLDTFGYLDFFKGSNIQVGLSHGSLGGSTLGIAGVSYSTANTVTIGISLSTLFLGSLAEETPGVFTSPALQAQLYEVTAHEMMHAVMYITHLNGMIDEAPVFGSTQGFPGWFVEGVAQAVGGPGNWLDALGSNPSNGTLQSSMNELGSGTGVDQYRAGYLASMYLGYLAGGSGSIDTATISNGLNWMLGETAAGKSLDQAIADNTKYAGLDAFQNALRNGADAGFYDFARGLIAAKGSGSGSLLAELGETLDKSGLNTSGETFMKVNPDSSAVRHQYPPGYNIMTGGGAYDAGSPVHADYDHGLPRGRGLALQVGPNEGDVVFVYIDSMRLSTLGIEDVDTLTRETASEAITKLSAAINTVSLARAKLGAYQNRLEHKIDNLNISHENLAHAESRIRDADMAKEMMALTKSNILRQSSTAMLAQANAIPQSFLQLLG